MEVKNRGSGKAGKIPPELLQKIKEAVNIVDIVGEHVVLRKSGSNHSGLCPFHSERTPSFSVSEGKQLYHCYGCKKGGDLVSFVMEIYGIPFPEAIEELANRARLALPKDWHGATSDDPEVERKRQAAREKLETTHRLTRFAAAFYHNQLAAHPAALQYFRQRGSSAELERAFYLGVAPPMWDSLATHLVNKKAPLPLAVELGLVRPSQKNTLRAGPGYFDLFRNRAMFPILDMRGKVAGFGGRALPPEIMANVAGAANVESEGPKYMNSAESFLFQKSRLVFGLYQAQKHIREKDEVVLVEGYFDVLALHAAGFENVVATCGTSLTPDHLALFRRFASRVTILFDGDKAGVAATERAMELGLEHGQILYGAAMPEGLDPDEILFELTSGTPHSNGKERMEEILKAARPILDTRIDEASAYAQRGSEERTQALKRVGRWLARYRDPVGKEVRLQALESRFQVDRRLLEQSMAQGADRTHRNETPAVNTAPRAPARPAAPPAPKKGTGPFKPTTWETGLLRLILAGGHWAGYVAEAVDKLPPGHSIADLFISPALRAFVLEFYADKPSTQGPAGANAHLHRILAEIDEPRLQVLVTEALLASESQATEEPEVRPVIDQAIRQCWARFSQQIKIAIADAEAKKDAELQTRLMKEYLDVRRKIEEFSSFYDEA